MDVFKNSEGTEKFSGKKKKKTQDELESWRVNSPHYGVQTFSGCHLNSVPKLS